MKLQTSILTAVATVLLTTVAHAQVTFTDIGTKAPTPGSLDISQLSTNASGGEPPGLNYYWDDGRGNPGTGFPSQTITTLGNAAGYTVTSLAIKTDAGGGDTPTQTQTFVLAFYEISGTPLTNATLIYTFSAVGTLSTEGDWILWSGLGLNLAPNSTYGYSFGITTSDPENWERISTATNLPYAGGQACLIPNAGGKINYSSTTNDYDMTFDLGLSAPGAPIADVPVESPSTASGGVVPGTDVTLSATAAGAATLSIQWQTDGGSGKTPTNVPAATSNNLVVNTTGWAAGTYSYDFVAANSLGSATSAVVTIFVPATSVTPSIGVQFEGDANGYAVLTPGLAAGFVPQQNWSVDDESSGNTATNIVDFAGNSTAVTVKVTFDAGQYGSADSLSTADGILMSGGYWTGDGYVITVTGVPYSSYDVYLYMLNDDNPNRRYGFTLGNQTNWGSVFDGNGYVVPPYTLDTQTEELAEGTQMQANLVKFANITTNSFTITGQTPDGNVALMGMQIVNPNAGPAVAAPITASPAAITIGNTVYTGSPVLLTENVTEGATPLFYQWLTDGGTGGALSPVAGATNGTLSLNSSTFATGNYAYEVVVSNALGVSTSAVLSVSVTASAPVLVTDIAPAPVDEGYVGETETFSAEFVGTLPLTYQWLLNTGSGFKAIPGATNTDLVLTNLQVAEAGSYSLFVSNSAGTNGSSTSVLTVLTDPAAPASGTYGATVLAGGPLAFWQLNETASTAAGDLPAYDATGHGFDGIYSVGSVDGAPGPSPTSTPFGFPGLPAGNLAVTTSQTGADNAYVSFPPLNINTNTVTITAWIYPSANEATSTGIVFSRNGNDAAGLCFDGQLNAAGMPGIGYTWNSNSSATWGFNSGIYPPLGQWSFVALVISQSNATMYLDYLDPVTGLADIFSAVNEVTNELETFSEGPGATNMIGTDPCCTASRSFSGSIGEVAFYEEALTQNQVLALFTKATGLGPFPPSISTQPSSTGAYAGRSVTFSAGGINGTTPFTYQWQFDGKNISGATNLSLVLSGLTAANEGTYDLIVSNSVSYVVSSNATLLVRTPVPGSYESYVLSLNPLAYWSLDDTNGAPGTGIAYEFVSGFTGIYGAGALYGAEGIAGPQSPQFPGFATNNFALECFNADANSFVSGPDMTTSLPATNLTFAMWINPQANIASWSGLLVARGGPNTGDGFGFGGTDNSAGQDLLTYTWNQNNGDTYGFISDLFPETNEWSFVAMVIQPANTTIYMMNESGGIQSAVNAVANDAEIFGEAMEIGNDDCCGAGRTFAGYISAVSIFTTALSSNQLVGLYYTALGKTPPSGGGVTLTIAKATTAGQVTLTWPSGVLVQATNLAGPWVTNAAAVSPYTVGTTNVQTYFEVQ